MTSSVAKLDQALTDLLEAFQGVEDEMDDRAGGDRKETKQSVIEALEGSIENSLDETSSSTENFAWLITALTEALQQLDPSAIESNQDGDFAYSEEDYDDDDDDEDDDLLDLDDDEDE